MKNDIKKQILETICMLLEANGLEERKQSVTGSMPTIFFEYSGHINALHVELYKNGWSTENERDNKWVFYLDDELSKAPIEAMTKEISETVHERTIEKLKNDIARKDREITDSIDQLTQMRATLAKMEGHE